MINFLRHAVYRFKKPTCKIRPPLLGYRVIHRPEETSRVFVVIKITPKITEQRIQIQMNALWWSFVRVQFCFILIIEVQFLCVRGLAWREFYWLVNDSDKHTSGPVDELVWIRLSPLIRVQYVGVCFSRVISQEAKSGTMENNGNQKIEKSQKFLQKMSIRYTLQSGLDLDADKKWGWRIFQTPINRAPIKCTF